MKSANVVFSKEDDFFQQDKLNVIAAGSILNIYIVYKLSLKTRSSSNALKNGLFSAILQILINGNIVVMVLCLAATVYLHNLMIMG